MIAPLSDHSECASYISYLPDKTETDKRHPDADRYREFAPPLNICPSENCHTIADICPVHGWREELTVNVNSNRTIYIDVPNGIPTAHKKQSSVLFHGVRVQYGVAR